MDRTGKLYQFARRIKMLWQTNRYFRPVLGLLIGGIAGFSYYLFVGCSSGSCAITSSPYMSTLFGAGLGFYMLGSPCAGNKC